MIYNLPCGGVVFLTCEDCVLCKNIVFWKSLALYFLKWKIKWKLFLVWKECSAGGYLGQMLRSPNVCFYETI